MSSPATRKVVSLIEYRAKKEPGPLPTIEIQLLPDGKIGYSTVGLDEQHVVQALIGCYAVMGEFIEQIWEKMKPGA